MALEDLNLNLNPSSPGFIFGGNTGLSYEQLQTRRKIAEQLLGRRSKFPQTLGEGLTYAGEQLGDAITFQQLQHADRAYQSGLAAQGAEAVRALPVGTGAPPVASPAAGAATTEAPDTAPAAPATAAAPDAAAPDIETGRNRIAAAAVPLPPPRPVYDRNPQLQELQDNPQLADRIKTIVRGETDDPREQQAVAESLFNRARARDTSLARETEQYTGPGSRGYYPASTFQRGAVSDDVLTPVLRGSDAGGQALGFSPTGNASGGVAARGVASGRYNASGALPGGAETFVQQERPEQLARLAASRLPGRDAIAAATMPPPAPIQVASLGGAPGAPAAPAAPALPLNPPIATDIVPAPPAVRTAQVPGAMSPSAPVPQPVVPRTPDATLRDQTEPVQPRPTPISPQEAEATRRMLLAPNDPNVQRIWGPVAAAHAAQRQFADTRNIEQYKERMQNYRTYQEFTRGAPERQQKMEKEAGDLATRAFEERQFGSVGREAALKQVQGSYEAVKTLPASAASIEMALNVLRNNPQMLTGATADVELSLKKLAAAAGFPLDPSVPPTEAFKSYIANVYGTLRPQVVGPGQQSIPELNTLKEAAAGKITLERGSIERILTQMQNLNTMAAVNHNKALSTFAGSDLSDPRVQNNWRALSGFKLPMNLFIPPSAVQHLRDHPELARQFDERFSLPGLADEILGAP